MYKCTSHLDQPFEEKIVLIPALEPQMLEHIMRFVVLVRIEAGEVALIARIQRQLGICAELGYKFGNAFIFFHRAIRGPETILRVPCA